MTGRVPLPDDDELFVRAARREGSVPATALEEARETQHKMRELGLVPKALVEILSERRLVAQEVLDGLQEKVARVKEAFRIPGYKLLERLGRGSMGTVYKARHLASDRVVALKILARFLSENEAFVRRFLKEARVIGRLNHPNIVQGFEAGEAEGTHYFAMEYCDGPTVLELLSRGGAMAPERVIRIGWQVAQALEHAHQRGLVHRDVKPDNIMIVSGGVAKLCDLGLAKDLDATSGTTDKGSTLGTPNYISPEQARGADVDIRSDLYSLGVTIFHMICGRVPFDGPNPTVIIVKHLDERAPRLREIVSDANPHLDEIVARMMAKHPDDRPQSPGEVVRVLGALVAQAAD